jgi:hypothetical protein
MTKVAVVVRSTPRGPDRPASPGDRNSDRQGQTDHLGSPDARSLRVRQRCSGPPTPAVANPSGSGEVGAGTLVRRYLRRER